MPDDKTKQFQISFSELDKLLYVLQELVDGVSKTVKLAKNERQKMRQSISETSEMISTILTTVKQRISILIVEMNDDSINVSQKNKHLNALYNFQEWEDQYRKFQMCEPLRKAAEELRPGIYKKLVGLVVFKNTKKLEQGIDTFISGERMAGAFVSNMLKEIAKLASKVDTDSKFVLRKLEKARDDLETYRDKFINIEKQMRATL